MPKLVIITEIIAPYRIPVFNALAQRHQVELHVIFLSENDPTLRQWEIYKNEIQFSYEVLPSWRARLGRHNLLINRGVRTALDRIVPDAVICGGYNYLASWSAAYWARAKRIPFLLWTESTAFDQRQQYRLVELAKKRFLNLCRGFVVPGLSSLHYLTNLGIETGQIFVAPNAVDTSAFAMVAEATCENDAQIRSRYGLPCRYFLYVGRMVKEKGIYDLLAAYAEVREEIRSQVGLVFVGDGADRNDLQRSLKINPGTIQFLGFKQREQLTEIYALAEALTFPTHSDPWGLVVNEAMACGLPIIVTNVAGCALDLVHDGSNGFVIPPKDIPKLAQTMTTLAENSELRGRMSRRSREQIQANSPSAWAEGIVKAVQTVQAI